MLFSFVAASSASAATLNNDPSDYPVANVKNQTLNPGNTSGYGTTAYASDGQVVGVDIYYHVTGTETANNLRVKLSPQTTGNGTSHTFQAQVLADNANTVIGSATVTLSSSQSLTFINGSVYWYPNQSFTASGLPNGQTGTEIFGNTGLNLGNIAPGWSTQGNVVVHFQVSGTNNCNNGYNCGCQNGVNCTGNAPLVTTNAATSVGYNNSTVQCYVDPRGTSDTQVWVDYGFTQSFSNQTSRQSNGTGAGNITFSMPNLAANTTYYYRCSASNSYGTTYGNTLSFYTQYYNNYNNTQYGTQPFVSTNSASSVYSTGATLNGYVSSNSNSSNTNAWFEWGPTVSLGNTTSSSNYGSSGITYNYNLSTLSPNTTYYYRAVASNPYGTGYGTILSFTTGQGSNYIGNTRQAPSVVTTGATGVTDTTARLNGIATIPSDSSTNGWFEFGTSQNLGDSTSIRYIGNIGSQPFSATISGLRPGTTYYYMASGSNSYGTDRGEIVSFRTTGTRTVTNTTTTRVTNNAFTYAKPTLVQLAVDRDAERLVTGQTTGYVVSYQNISNRDLTDVVLKVVLPNELTYKSASAGIYSPENNTLTLAVGTLHAGDKGTVRITTDIKNDAQVGKTIVVTAYLDYTDPSAVNQAGNNQQEEVVAYTTGLIDHQSNGLAAGVGFSGFFPNTLFGWLLILAIIFILTLLARNLFGSYNTQSK